MNLPLTQSMTAEDWAAEEVLRAQAEAAGELDHISKDLRPLAKRMVLLNLDPENAQDHDPRNLKIIAGSMQKSKQRTPLVINAQDAVVPNRIMKGNGTYTCAKMLQWEWIAAVKEEDDPDDAMAYGMVDNRASATSKINYSQTNKNMRRLQEVGHPTLDLMYTPEEAMPLLREEFQPAAVSTEEFEATMVKGRAIKNITAHERGVVDQAIELYRAQSSKALTEGACLAKICENYLSATAMTAAVEGEITPVAPEEDVLPLEM